MTHNERIAVQLRPDPPTEKGVYDECALWLSATLGFRIATEVSPGEDKPVVLWDKLTPDVLKAYLINNGLVTWEMRPR